VLEKLRDLVVGLLGEKHLRKDGRTQGYHQIQNLKF
jgi:hypothetical protein